MIFTECVYCGESFTVQLDNTYLGLLHRGHQLVSKYYCESCGKVNFVEHRRVSGETFGEDDPRVRRMSKL